ncbi:MAG: TetR/AcrR family transcriptional regulator [Solirubrobacterales bacterium]|nr:TetR/AcrR family transcriptional regulator [Solirubrobacterales bacterium]HMT06074.1 TetR/AcrR family transcriptional regulator [Solirubrobacterales bacterium]
MNSSTGYRLGKRAISREQTRKRILDASENLFLEYWYDDVSLQEIAGQAGVALQTVVNHFGSKGSLLAEVAARMSEQVNRQRDEVQPGDVSGALKMLVSEYESLGDTIVRFISLEGRVEEIGPLLTGGRTVHRSWVERVFSDWLPSRAGNDRKRSVAMLVAATDVLTWKVLRREQGLNHRETELAMRCSVLSLLEGFGK